MSRVGVNVEAFSEVGETWERVKPLRIYIVLLVRPSPGRPELVAMAVADELVLMVTEDTSVDKLIIKLIIACIVCMLRLG